ncbi:MAG: type I methionyl aminopeptidase [Candidatus Omnitrophica bacterium]|nr:type I methionyl aminopeptidase [Candidatus Omnitrophota bacterium]
MIELKSSREIDTMREAGRMVSIVLQEIEERIAPGVTTQELNERAEKTIYALGGEPAFKGYRGYPASICASVNEEVVHGIPGRRVLEEGDIVGIDVGVRFHGYYGDSAVTFPVGQINEETGHLLEVTHQALFAGIEKAVAGNRIGDISSAVQRVAESNGYSVVRDFVGHGIGSEMHQDPQVPNFGEPRQGILLKKGMVLAIEPMVNVGTYEVEILPDGWTVITKDRKRSCHFEHTVSIDEKEPEILTAWHLKKNLLR